MHIDPNYDRYYIYSAVLNNGILLTSGACSLIWQPDAVLQGGKWKPGLTWADGNYHLYNDNLANEDAQFIEECMFTALNEADETSGTIIINNSSCIVRWCLLKTG